MRILIDIGHPAHVHLFKNFAKEMQENGHQVLFTCREKEFELELLQQEKFNYKSMGKKYLSKIGKLWGLLEFDFKEWLIALSFMPDLFLSHGSQYAAHAAFLMRKPHISFEDTFNFEQIWLYKSFTDVILTSDYEHPLKSDKVIRYAGYHELAYLHPKHFTPDKTIRQELGVKEDEKYAILRFVAWNASHDIGHKGISMETKRKAITLFSKHARVFISSETTLPVELKPYQMQINPHRMHDAMGFSSLVFGESATMVSESNMLGVPGIYLDNTGRLYTKELQEKYDLCYCYSESKEDQQKAIEKGLELLQRPNLKKEWLQKRDRMLQGKIDVTAFLFWFVENYPASKYIMKENSGYQYRFR